MPVYKYLTPERIDVVSSARIRFTQAGALNDPFELKPFFKTILNSNTFRAEMRRHLDLEKELSDRYESMPAAVKGRFSRTAFVTEAMSELSNNREKFEALFELEAARSLEMQESIAPDMRLDIHQRLGSDFGILSLTDDPSNELMWAHYASSHFGFVLEFDESSPFFSSQRSANDEFYRLRPVKYLAQHLSAESFEEINTEHLLVSKRDVWAYERELRMLIPLANRKPELSGIEDIHLVPFPKSMLKRIIFGVRSTQGTIDQALATLAADHDYRHVGAGFCVINPENGELLIQPNR